jgi:hypothetical protein
MTGLNRSNAAKHGTRSGAQKHRRLGEPPCERCRKAEAAERLAQWRAKRDAARNVEP